MDPKKIGGRALARAMANKGCWQSAVSVGRKLGSEVSLNVDERNEEWNQEPFHPLKNTTIRLSLKDAAACVQIEC